jgi:hypothetical protein
MLTVEIGSDTPIGRELMKADLQRMAEPRIFDTPPPPAPKPMAHPMVVLPSRFVGGRLYVWTIRQLTTPKRIIRLLLWAIRLPVRLGSLVGCLFGGIEERAEYLTRMSICGECADRIVHLSLKRDRVCEKSYCGRCGCPPWYLSRLDNKNWLSGWRCPKRLHPGPYGDEPIREWLQAAGYDVDRVMHGSCPGCSNGQKGT